MKPEPTNLSISLTKRESKRAARVSLIPSSSALDAGDQSLTMSRRHHWRRAASPIGMGASAWGAMAMDDELKLREKMVAALESHSVRDVIALLGQGVKPNEHCPHWTSEMAFIRRAVDLDDIDCARAMLEHGGNVHDRQSISKEPLISLAARQANAAMCELLVAHGANVNDTDRYGHTALTSLGRSSQNADKIIETAATLLRLGADPTHKALSNETALHRAVENRSPKAAMLLIDHGCPIDVADSEGDTALERIAKLPQDGAPASRLYLVFRAAGVDPEQIPQAVWRLFSPLQAAAAVGWTSRCLSLLEQGESERPSESAPSANEWAEQGGHMETASTILAWLARKQISNIIEQSCSHIMKGIQHG